MKTRLAALFAAALLPLSISGSAVADGKGDIPITYPPYQGSMRVVVSDPTGDVTGVAPKKLRQATDATKVIYQVKPNMVTANGGRVVVIRVKHGKSLLGPKYRHRAVTRFTAGNRKYKAVVTRSNVALFVKRGDNWLAKGNWISSDVSGGTMTVIFPTTALNGAGSLTDLRTSIRLDGTDVRDTTQVSRDFLLLYPIR